jgi:hypothetical protein
MRLRRPDVCLVYSKGTRNSSVYVPLSYGGSPLLLIIINFSDILLFRYILVFVLFSLCGARLGVVIRSDGLHFLFGECSFQQGK